MQASRLGGHTWAEAEWAIRGLSSLVATWTVGDPNWTRVDVDLGLSPIGVESQSLLVQCRVCVIFDIELRAPFK